jgi:copper(I)-binding protein
MEMAGGIMRMRPIDGADVAANGALTFAPGGAHLMIYDLKPGTVALPLTFRMKSGATATVTAPVRTGEPEAAAPHGSH